MPTILEHWQTIPSLSIERPWYEPNICCWSPKIYTWGKSLNVPPDIYAGSSLVKYWDTYVSRVDRSDLFWQQQRSIETIPKYQTAPGQNLQSILIMREEINTDEDQKPKCLITWPTDHAASKIPSSFNHIFPRHASHIPEMFPQKSGEEVDLGDHMFISFFMATKICGWHWARSAVVANTHKCHAQHFFLSLYLQSNSGSTRPNSFYCFYCANSNSTRRGLL